MEFIKYQSLENSYRFKSTDWVIANIPNEKIWSVTEKLDGANIGIYCDITGIKVASRNQFINTNEFYSCTDAVESVYDNVINMFNNGFSEDLEIAYIIVYGELCGKGVMSRVDYGDKQFKAFDIRVVMHEKHENSEGIIEHVSEFLPWTLFKHACEIYNIPTVKELYGGAFKDCLAFQNDLNSKVLDTDKENTMEGVVIKGRSENFKSQFGGRIVFKNKNEKFTEKSAKIRVKKPPIAYDNDDVILSYINVNRVNALLSKLGGLGAITQKDYGKILGLFCKDVIEDLVNDLVIPSGYKQDGVYKDIGKFVILASKPLLLEEVLSKL